MSRDTVILVGGAGYIGRHVAWKLHDEGYQCVIIDDLSTGSKQFLPPCDFIEADITQLDEGSLRPWVGKVHAVMHFAALTSAPESVQKPASYYRVNVGGTVRALELASFLGTKIFVFSSTAAVYGEPSQLPVNESHPLQPQNPYGNSKKAAEMAVSDYCRAHGISGVLLRYFNVAGSDPDFRTGDMRPPSGNLIHQLLTCLDGKDREFQIFGDDYDTPDGTPRRDFVHVSDIASAHVYMMRNPEKVGDTVSAFNIGYGQPYSVREILEEFERLVPDRFAPTIRVQGRRPGDIAEIWSDNDALRRIGWQPEHDDIHRLLKDSIDWFWHLKSKNR